MNSKFVPAQLVKSLDELIAEEKKSNKKGGGSQFFKKAIKKDKRYLGEQDEQEED
jgi:hypothetical protein